MKRTLALLAVLAVTAITALAAVAANGITNKAYRLNDIVCDSASDSASGTWSARSISSLSTSESIAVVGSKTSDQCNVVLGSAAAASNQYLSFRYTCAIATAGTAKLALLWEPPAINNINALGTITPKQGQRCVRVSRLAGQ